MYKKALIAVGLLFAIQTVQAQYELRQNITFGLNYTNLWAKTFDKEDIAHNIDTTYYNDKGERVDSLRANAQDTKMDFVTEATFNYFIGYKLTLDFNQRYSFDIGLVLNRKGYTTAVNKKVFSDFDGKETLWEDIYESTVYFPLAGHRSRYHEDYEVYRLEIPFYTKINMNTFLSVYGGVNLSFELWSTDEHKPLGTRSLTNKGTKNVIVGQYYTDTGTDIDGVIGIDARFNKNISFFAQGEIGLMDIAATRDSGIRFYGLKLGINYVFHRQ